MPRDIAMSDITPISRRQFIHTTAMAAALAAAAGATLPHASAEPPAPGKPLRPRCLTMWDFSWIERRWPGAGYEDWPLILDELRERGYDAIRLDAFPHLIASDPEKSRVLPSCQNSAKRSSPAVSDAVRQQIIQ